MRMKFTFSALALGALMAFQSKAELPLVYDQENTGVACEAPVLPAVSELVAYPLLPDPFAWSDGSGRVEDFSEWACRRNEIKAEIEHYEIGPKPGKPELLTSSLAGNTLTVEITHNGETLVLTSTVTVPEGEGPFPVVIGMNSGTGSLPASLFEGVIQIAFMHDQVVTSSHQGERDPDAAYFRLYPELEHVGYYSAWSWGISRLIDGIEEQAEALKANTQKIAVTGCSYAGKMALFAGAFDERIALTIAQESGGGGVNAWRVAEVIGEVEKLGNTNYSWFMQSLRTNFNGKVNLLPYDHHELMAMIVPRALLVLGNPDMVWLGDEAGYVASRAVEEVYNTFGIEDRFGFSFRKDHQHCQLPEQSFAEVGAFVDRFLFDDETADTYVRYHTFPGVDYDYWIKEWRTPPNPNTPSISLSTEAASSLVTPASFTVSAEVSDLNDDVVKVVFYNGDQIIAEVTEEPYELVMEDVGQGSYNISARAIDAEELVGYSNIISIDVVLPEVKVYKTTTPPGIDGAIDPIWEDARVVPMEAATLLTGAITSAEDLSGYAKAVWTDTHIYLLADVTDDVLVNDGPQIYEDDNVEFYFDGNNAKAAAYDSDDVQYTFRWNDGTNIGSIPAAYSKEGIVYAIKERETGYVVEVKIPWSTLQITPENGKKVGFDFMINDDDTGGGRDAKLSWNAQADQAWQNPALFGTIVLTDDEVLVSLKKDARSSAVALHPNPVKDFLYVSGLKGEFAFEIFNLSGNRVLSGSADQRVSVASLQPGIYFIRTIDGEGAYQFKFLKD